MLCVRIPFQDLGKRRNKTKLKMRPSCEGRNDKKIKTFLGRMRNNFLTYYFINMSIANSTPSWPPGSTAMTKSKDRHDSDVWIRFNGTHLSKMTEEKKFDKMTDLMARGELKMVS